MAQPTQPQTVAFGGALGAPLGATFGGARDAARDAAREFGRDPRLGPVGVICAIPDELAAIAAPLREARADHFGPLPVRYGRLAGVPVILALAGIGKVDAAMAATLLASAGARSLVAAGVASAVNPAVGIGDIVVGTRLVQHDFGLATDEGITVYAAGQLPIPSIAPASEPRMDDALEQDLRTALSVLVLDPVSVRLDQPPRRPGIHFGTVATGDVFVNGHGVRNRIADLGALVVDMEGAAVARVARLFGITSVVLRAASGLASRENALDLATFLPAAARSVARVAEIVIPRL